MRYSTRVDRDEILRVLRAFEASGLEYVLIGATAMGLHGLVRATEDIDVLVRATRINGEKIIRALKFLDSAKELNPDWFTPNAEGAM